MMSVYLFNVCVFELSKLFVRTIIINKRLLIAIKIWKISNAEKRFDCDHAYHTGIIIMKKQISKNNPFSTFRQHMCVILVEQKTGQETGQKMHGE